MSSTSIRLDLDGTVVEASLNDTPAARALARRLPLTLDFSDYGGQEVLAELGDPLPMDGMPSGESAPAGTIGYYAPDNVLVLYYEDVARFSGIVRLGHFDGDLDLLTEWTAPRSVRLETAG